jgi:hypothetical protein
VLTVNELSAKVINALHNAYTRETAEQKQALQEVLGIDLQNRDLRYADLFASIRDCSGSQEKYRFSGC